MIRNGNGILWMALACLVAAGCDDAPDMGPIGDAGMGDGGPTGDAGTPPAPLFLSTAQFAADPADSVGRLGWVTPGPDTVELASEVNPDVDTVVARAGATPFALARTAGLVHIQSATDPLVHERTIDVNPEGVTGDFASNPQTVIGVAEDRAYVVTQARNELVVIDPRPSGAADPTGTVDLSAFHVAADMDGVVDPSDAVRIGDRVYVTLSRSWFDAMSFTVQFEGSLLVAVDVTTDTVIDLDDATAGTQGIALDGNVSGAGLAHDPVGERLFVVTVGAFNQLDGGIEEVDLATGTSRGLVLTEATLGRDVGGLVWVDGSRAYVRLAAELDETFTPVAPSEVRVWNPSTGDVETEAFATDVDGMHLHDGVLYLWSDGMLEWFEAASGTRLGGVTVSDEPVFSAVAFP